MSRYVPLRNWVETAFRRRLKRDNNGAQPIT